MSLLIKIGLVVLVVAITLAWLGRGRRLNEPKPGAGAASDPAKGDSGAQRQASGEPLPSMVSCAHCGVHLPASEACQDGALSYCSERHRDAGPRR
jgi:uncharacterized protein